MSFTFPQFFWAFFALAIPILIHLFNLRKHKTVYFSNTRFLQEVQRSTKAIKRLKEYILLALRLLALSAIILAFARPVLPIRNDLDKDFSQLSIYLDNSYSMKSSGSEASLFNKARQNAVRLIKSLKPDASVQILTNNFEAKYQRFYSPKEAIQLIDELDYSPAFRSFKEIKSRIIEASSRRENKGPLQVILISDFQATSFKDWSEEDIPANWQVKLLALNTADEAANLAIDSLWLESPVLIPNFTQKLAFQLKNYGSKDLKDVSLSLKVNEQIINQQKISIPAQGIENASLEFLLPSAGNFKGQLEIESSGGAQFDDVFYFQLKAQNKVAVYILAPQGQSNLNTSLFRDSLFELRISAYEDIDFDALQASELIIAEVQDELSSGLLVKLNEHLAAAKNLFIIPSGNATGFAPLLANYGLALNPNWQNDSLRVVELNYQDPYFRGVFLSETKNPDLPFSRKFFRAPTGILFPLLKFENGEAMLFRQPYAKGDIFISLSAIEDEFSNFSSHPVALPLLYNAALFKKEAASLYLSPGLRKSSLLIDLPYRNDQPLILKVGPEELIPPQEKRGDLIELSIPEQDLKPGIYPLQRAKESLAFLALNVDKRESEIKCLNSTELQEASFIEAEQIIGENEFENYSLELKTLQEDQSLAHWFILAALIFLIIEMLINKNSGHEEFSANSH
tara:strand:+ start:6410 stop:8458 length:2049 start_codon:yes stop_codon:yes gene_type:complete